MQTDVPHEFEGVYDIVHVCNVVFVLSDEEVVAMVSKLSKLVSMIVFARNHVFDQRD